MSIKQMLLVWEHEFPHPEQSVMLALADHAHEDGTGIRPSVNRLAWKTGYSRRNVQIILKGLKESGILHVEREATPRKPATLRIDWSMATPKQPFEEYQALANSEKSQVAQAGRKKRQGGTSRGEEISPLARGEEISPLGCNPDHPRGEEISPLGCNPVHPRGELGITPGVNCGSPEPSKNRPKNRQKPPKKTKEPKRETRKKGGEVPSDAAAAPPLNGSAARSAAIAALNLQNLELLTTEQHGFTSDEIWIGPGIEDWHPDLLAGISQSTKGWTQEQPPYVWACKWTQTCQWGYLSSALWKGRSLATRVAAQDTSKMEGVAKDLRLSPMAKIIIGGMKRGDTSGRSAV